MKKRLLLFIILLIFIFSSISFYFILNYLDPYEYKTFSISLIIISFILSVSSFLTLLLFFLKKVYYRWNVYVYNVISSFRQWFLISIFLIWLIIFNKIWAWIYLTWFLFFIFLFFIELFIRNIIE